MDTPKQDDTSTKQSKAVACQKARSYLKTVVEIPPQGANSRNQKEDNITVISPPRKDLSTVQTKQVRQPKKTANGVKSVEQSKAKHSKQKSLSKKATAKSLQKATSVPSEKPTLKNFFPTAELPPPISPIPTQLSTPNRPNTANQTMNTRPPPGLLAPPGFVDQPDLEGLSNPSSPVSSPQRLTSHRSQTIQPLPDIIPGMEIMNSSPLNDGLLSLIGNEGKLPNSSLFQTQPSDVSTKVSTDNGASIPLFSPQSFTPPILETESKSAEAPDVQALLGAGSDFNVSNFLDGILSDQAHQPPIRNEAATKPTEVSESKLFPAKTVGVSLDPWNNNLLSDNNPSDMLPSVLSNQESSVIAGIPLHSSTPSLLAASKLQSKTNTAYTDSAYANRVNDIGGDDNDFLEPDSFYNQLLGED